MFPVVVFPCMHPFVFHLYSELSALWFPLQTFIRRSSRCRTNTAVRPINTTTPTCSLNVCVLGCLVQHKHVQHFLSCSSTVTDFSASLLNYWWRCSRVPLNVECSISQRGNISLLIFLPFVFGTVQVYLVDMSLCM